MRIRTEGVDYMVVIENTIRRKKFKWWSDAIEYAYELFEKGYESVILIDMVDGKWINGQRLYKDGRTPDEIFNN